MSFIPPDRPTVAGAPSGGGNGVVRAETPPAGYWRRWCADAPPPEAVATAQAAVAEAAPADHPPQVVPAEQGEPPYRILIVEDDRSQALFAQSILKGSGMDTEVVAMPGEAMAAMDRFRPDLLLMDLHMPGMSSTELTTKIRGHGGYAHIPVVFLTGDTDPERHLEVLDSGADDYPEQARPPAPPDRRGAEPRAPRARPAPAARAGSAPASGHRPADPQLHAAAAVAGVRRPPAPCISW